MSRGNSGAHVRRAFVMALCMLAAAGLVPAQAEPPIHLSPGELLGGLIRGAGHAVTEPAPLRVQRDCSRALQSCWVSSGLNRDNAVQVQDACWRSVERCPKVCRDEYFSRRQAGMPPGQADPLFQGRRGEDSSCVPGVDTLTHGGRKVAANDAAEKVNVTGSGKAVGADAHPLLHQIQVRDTCGARYADKLAACEAFRCQRPGPMAMMTAPPTRQALAAMSPQQRNNAQASMAKAEKALAAMSPQEREALKTRMTSTLEITGYDARGRCRVSTLTTPGQRMDCKLDKALLGTLSDHARLAAGAEHIQVNSESSLRDGKMVTRQVDVIDGKAVSNPWMEALDKGQCVMLEKTNDNGWVSLDSLNRMGHIEVALLAHGKPVAGRVRILDSATGNVVFNKAVDATAAPRTFDLEPGVYDIEMTGKDTALPPVIERGIKLGEGNVHRKTVEFYAVSGTLRLTLRRDGEPVNMAVYMTDPDTHAWLYLKAPVFGKKPSFYFKSSSIKLPETLTGNYAVFVTPVLQGFAPPRDAHYERFLLHVRNGEVVEKNIVVGNDKAQPSSRKPVAGTAASTRRDTLFILDASGSMWGRIDGKPKITIARDVMAKLVPELPDDSGIGLIAYGHRRKGDCSDVETLVQPGLHEKQTVLKAVAGLHALGKTPLTRSVNQAIELLRSTPSTSTVVLVSDGIESCGGDPCAAVKAARASGVNFVLHTVGFGLSRQESRQLQCMAKAGGGEYFQADNAEELLASARKAVQPAGVLKITVRVNGAVSGFMYRVEDRDSGKALHETVLPAPSGAPIRLAEGRYRVFVSPAGVAGAGEQSLDIAIKPGELIEKSLGFDKGTLTVSVTLNGKPVHALVHVEDPHSHAWLYQSSVFGVDTPVSIDLPAGKVDVVVQAEDHPEQRVEGIELVAGKAVDRVIPVEVAAPAPAAASAGELEPDTDRPGGGDFQHTVPSTDDPALCRTACMRNARCKAWTYVRPNTVQGPQPNCWLKESVPAAVPNTCCVSGVKAGAAP